MCNKNGLKQLFKLYQSISYFYNTSLILSNAQSKSSLSIFSGGAKRMTLSCVSLHNSPFSLSFSQYARAGSCSSTPINKPFPRTSLIFGLSSFLSSAIIYSPSSRERSTKFSSSITSRAAIDTAQAKGFPPKVEPWEPGLQTPKMSSLATTQEIGNTPPPRAFPKIYISGSTFSQSQANIFPLRPRPA